MRRWVAHLWLMASIGCLPAKDSVTDGSGGEATETGDSVHERMVYFPEGSFEMGCIDPDDPECEPDEYPRHEVWLDAFWLDAYEVTIAEYLGCVESGGCTPAPGTDCDAPIVGHEDHPVRCMSWEEAREYCKWAGKRLPTEAEWERAAAGTEGRRYPWGEHSPTCYYANTMGCIVPGDTVPVGSIAADVTPDGVHDLGGNVTEWLADWYGEKYYEVSPSENPPGPDDQNGLRSGRGGNWFDPSDYARSTNRNPQWAAGWSPYRGMRCAMTP